MPEGSVAVEQVDLRDHSGEAEFKAGEIARRKNHMLGLGFSEKWLTLLASKKPTLYDPGVLDKRLSFLKDQGFENPQKIIAGSPVVLRLAEQNIINKIEFLKAQGFKDPQKMISSTPSILNLPEKTIIDKIKFLESQGFDDSQRLITLLPNILSYSEQNITDKVKFLKDQGFKNPVKLMTSFTGIFGLSEQIIIDKLKILKDRGFENPQDLIESLPTLIGLSEENLVRRLRFLDKAIKLYNLPFTTQSLMEHNLALFSSKFEKILVLARVLREYHVNRSSLTTNLMRDLLYSNLEDTLIALSERKGYETIYEFLKRVREVKQRTMSKEDKRKVIAKDFESFDKIKRDYFRGYPETEGQI